MKHDKQHQEARYIAFNFQALCEKAIAACPGARDIVKYEKKEGNFNRVFLLEMDNGSRVVARIPFRISGPRRLATNSEVATTTYCMVALFLSRVV